MNGVKAKKTKEKLAVMRSCCPEKPKIWSFHVAVLQRTATKCTTIVRRTCRVLFLLINPIVLWRSRYHRRRRCLSSLLLP